MIEILAGLGIFIGCFARTMLPFLKKKYSAVEQGEPFKWEGRYTLTLIFSIVVAAISTMFILPAFEIPSSFVFPMAFAYGWAANDIINQVAT